MLSRWLAVPFLDFLLFLLALTVLLIHPETQQRDASRPVADFALFVVWDQGRNTDLDTYVQGPTGEVLWYRRRDLGYISLDRDDLGRARDSGPSNQEIVSFRQPPDGSYLVSVHTYREQDQGRGQVKLELLDRAGKQLWTGALAIPLDRDEAPVIEFEFRSGKFAASYPSGAMIRYAAEAGSA